MFIKEIHYLKSVIKDFDHTLIFNFKNSDQVQDLNLGPILIGSQHRCEIHGSEWLSYDTDVGNISIIKKQFGAMNFRFSSQHTNDEHDEDDCTRRMA